MNATGTFPLLPPRGVDRAAPGPISIFLPKEHGSWSLIAEPLALGLAVAASPAGVALTAAALAGFFARRPFRASFASEPSARRLSAREALVMLTALAVAGIFEAGVLGGWANLWPLALAGVFGCFFGVQDLRGDARSSGAELAGGAAGALLAGALGSLAGLPPLAALTLSLVAAARSLSAIATVRAYVRARKGGRLRPGVVVAVATLPVAALLALSARGLAPAGAVGVAAVWGARSLWLLGPWRPDWPASRIGAVEAVLGAASVIVLAMLWRAASAVHL